MKVYNDPEKIIAIEEYINSFDKTGDSALKKDKITLEKGDRVFVYKNCKFKRRPLNELLKAKKADDIKRTFKIEEATIIVMPEVSGTFFTYAPKFHMKDGSIDGIEEKHDAIRGISGSFKKCRKSIEMLRNENINTSVITCAGSRFASMAS